MDFFSEALLREQEARKIPLLNAISQKNVLEVKRLISVGADVNKKAPGGGKTALHLVLEVNDNQIMNLLIEAKADVNATTQTKTTPLHVAAQQGNISAIEKLARAGAKVDCISVNGCTPLHEAAAKGHIFAVIKLLEFKANPNIRDSRLDLTPANLAQEYGYEKVKDTLAKAMTYQQRFMQDIRFIIFKMKKVIIINSKSFQFLNNLGKKLEKIEEADQIFLIIREELKSDSFRLVKKELQSVKKLLVEKMHLYNTEKNQHVKEEQWKTLTPLLKEFGLLAKSKKQKPGEIILEYCDLARP